MSQRLEQVSGHLSNAHGRGLLAGEVAIITGMFPVFGLCQQRREFELNTCLMLCLRCRTGMAHSIHTTLGPSFMVLHRVSDDQLQSYLQKKEPRLSLASKLYIQWCRANYDWRMDHEILALTLNVSRQLNQKSSLLVATFCPSLETSVQMISRRKLLTQPSREFDTFPNHFHMCCWLCPLYCHPFLSFSVVVVLSLSPLPWISKYGKINHIVNNAGFTFDKMLHTTPDETFDIILKIHVRAPFRLIRQAAPYFRVKVRLNMNELLCYSHWFYPPSFSIYLGLELTFFIHCAARATRKPLHHQRFFHLRSARKRRPSKLCCCQSRRHWTHQDDSKGMGRFRCTCEHNSIRSDSHTVSVLLTSLTWQPH